MSGMMAGDLAQLDALRKTFELDGDLWHVPLPRRRGVLLPPGRGYLVTGGTCELLQVAQP